MKTVVPSDALLLPHAMQGTLLLESYAHVFAKWIEVIKWELKLCTNNCKRNDKRVSNNQGA